MSRPMERMGMRRYLTLEREIGKSRKFFLGSMGEGSWKHWGMERGGSPKGADVFTGQYGGY